MKVTKRQSLYNRFIQLNPPQILALGFFCLIVAGGLLLKLPFATKVHISWVDAFLQQRRQRL